MDHHPAKINTFTTWRDKVMQKLDLTGLTQQDIQIVREIVEALKARTAGKLQPKTETSDIEFHTWPLGVKGKVTRDEIYDYL
jgi:hypothetical protein